MCYFLSAKNFKSLASANSTTAAYEVYIFRPTAPPSAVASATAPRKAYLSPLSPPCYEKSIAEDDAFRMEAPPGFEPGSQGFADLCLTTWLWRQKNSAESTFGAGNETRTRDIHLGKVTLYH